MGIASGPESIVRDRTMTGGLHVCHLVRERGVGGRSLRSGMGEQGLEPRATIHEPPAHRHARESGRLPFPDGAAKHWILSSIVWLTAVDLFGLLLATELVTPA